MSEQWVWELDFITEDQHYTATQGVDKVVPPRMAPAVLRCPADVQLFVNSQSVLTSYWMHPENTFKSLGSIKKQNNTMLAFEGDPLYETAACGCRFHSMEPPIELDTTHEGGAHILFVNGTVRFFNDPLKRKRIEWEKRAGWDPREIATRHGW